MKFSGLILILLLVMVASLPSVAIFGYMVGFTWQVVTMAIIGSCLGAGCAATAYENLVSRNQFERFIENRIEDIYRKFGASVTIKTDDFKSQIVEFLHENSIKKFIIKETDINFDIDQYDDAIDIEEDWAYEVIFLRKDDAVKFKLMWVK